MSNLQEKVYKALPHFAQNILVTFFDYKQYKKRHGRFYNQWRSRVAEEYLLSYDELRNMQANRLLVFLKKAAAHSNYYKKCLSNINNISEETLSSFYESLPIQTKEDIRSNIQDIYTISKSESIVAKTGGTTGKSLEVRFTENDIQERYARLDFFRKMHGYELGDKVAWFSGKSILTNRDIDKKRFWKYDWLYKIRYYSTFHISPQNIKYYIDNLNKFKPSFIVGFPSSIYEIAKWGLANNYLLEYKVRTIFPTAETIVEHEKSVLKSFFGAQVRNQYASSEGAPFIFECVEGNLHIDLVSGFFEVLDAQKKSSKTGDLVFTSFSTNGTPLIRYAIRDNLTLSDKKCTCGNNNPLAEAIEGRINDFIFSRERGKINLGNVSNCVKYVNGVIKFQIIQDSETEIDVRIVKDEQFTQRDEDRFKFELEERLGKSVKIAFQYMDNIDREKSGKYRIIRNSLNL